MASCDCGRLYRHITWCELAFRGVIRDDEDYRFDVRACVCGEHLHRPMPEDVSVCMNCLGWSGRRKTITVDGVLCGACALTEIATGGLRCVGQDNK